MIRAKNNIFVYFITVLGIVTLGIPYKGAAETEKHISTLIQIELFEESISALMKDIGRYPTTDEGLNILINKPTDTKSWNGPYLSKPLIPDDYWGNKYIYLYPAQYGNKDYDLYSIGKNKKDDHGKHDDISNWKGANKGLYRNFSFNQISLYIILLAIFALLLYALIRRKRRQL